MADGTISLASMILEARAALGLSPTELGERLGHPVDAIESWERGETLPDPESISALAVALELDARDLADAAGPDLHTSDRVSGESSGRGGDDTALEPALDDGSTALMDRSGSDRGSVDDPGPAAAPAGSAESAESAEGAGSREGTAAPAPPDGGFGNRPTVEGTAAVAADVWTELDGSDPSMEQAGAPPIEGVRADPEVPEAVRPAGVTPAGVDPLEWVRKGALWIRNRWRRRRLLARAPTAVRSYVEDDRQATTYRIRQVLTAVALIALVLLLRWAWGQFAEAVSSLFDTMRSAV